MVTFTFEFQFRKYKSSGIQKHEFFHICLAYYFVISSHRQKRIQCIIVSCTFSTFSFFIVAKIVYI